jgi:hypothetical protein
MPWAPPPCHQTSTCNSWVAAWASEVLRVGRKLSHGNRHVLCQAGLTLPILLEIMRGRAYSAYALSRRFDNADLSASDRSLGGKAIARLLRLTVHLLSGNTCWTPLLAESVLAIEFPTIAAELVGSAQARHVFVSTRDVRCGHARCCQHLSSEQIH